MTEDLPAEPFKPLGGGCVCGGTRYLLGAVPTDTSDCHCMDCRRSSGAPFVTWGSVPRGVLEITAGGLRRIEHAERIRCFAACCGTHLFFEEAADSAIIDVAIATLDEPAAFRPARIIWAEDRLPWVVLDPALPQFLRSSSA